MRNGDLISFCLNPITNFQEALSLRSGVYNLHSTTHIYDSKNAFAATYIKDEWIKVIAVKFKEAPAENTFQII